MAHPYHTKTSKQQQRHALHSVVGVAQTMANAGNNCTPRGTRTIRSLLNIGFFFFMPALLLKLASASTYTTPLATWKTGDRKTGDRRNRPPCRRANLRQVWISVGAEAPLPRPRIQLETQGHRKPGASRDVAAAASPNLNRHLAP